jgi:hypothetical protein
MIRDAGGNVILPPDAVVIYEQNRANSVIEKKLTDPSKTGKEPHVKPGGAQEALIKTRAALKRIGG